MTGFDLGESAPDADDEPEEPDADDEPEDEQNDETTDTDSTTETTNGSESDHFENVGPDPSTVNMSDGDENRESYERDPTETGPAFPYSKVRQNPLYAHDEVWTEFEDQVDTTIVPELRKRGIRDDELREIHTVALEIVLDNLAEIPERLAENRKEMQ